MAQLIGTEITEEFKKWYNSLNQKEKRQVDVRLSQIRDIGYFGDTKRITSLLAELRWKNGRRVYFTRLKEQSILILLGGYKNEQKKQIKRAKLLIRRLTGYQLQGENL